MIMVETSVWIDYVNGAITPQTNILETELQENRIIVGDIIIAEFLQGFHDDKQSQQAKSSMDCLEYHDLVGKEIAYHAAKNYHKPRKQGISMPWKRSWGYKSQDEMLTSTTPQFSKIYGKFGSRCSLRHTKRKGFGQLLFNPGL